MATQNSSTSQVLKVKGFRGSLSPRALYVYLPAEYITEPKRHYPVLYMHDGQNVFEQFVEDSYVGSWRADEVADRLIAERRMRPSIIVGVSNGVQERMAEYLPNYVSFEPQARGSAKKGEMNKAKRTSAQKSKIIQGHADLTVAYYHEVADYVGQLFRTLPGRENRATCGSSMGGLLSAYMAWEHAEFAQHHAIMSPSFWITKCPQTADRYETIERFRTGDPRDVRLWLDCGTVNDGLAQVLLAQTALNENGYNEGTALNVHVAQGARHNEPSWSARLDQVFEFLFPQESHE